MIQLIFSDQTLDFIVIILLFALAIAYLVCSKLFEHTDLMVVLMLTAIFIIFILAVSGEYNHTLFAIAIMIIVFVLFLKLKNRSDTNV